MSRCHGRSVLPEKRFSNSYSSSNHPLNLWRWRRRRRLRPSGWYFCRFVILWRRRRTRPRHHHNHHRTQGRRDLPVEKQGNMVLEGVRQRGGPLVLLCCGSKHGPPGPTMYAMSRAIDQASKFRLFITPTVENIILKMTNREGRRKYGDEWRGMDETDLHTYVGLLISAGLYRSRGEAAASLWDTESGRAIFRATMPLKLFHTYSSFDDRETRRATDKLAAVWELWDVWVAQLPSLRPEVTVDEQLVPFRG